MKKVRNFKSRAVIARNRAALNIRMLETCITHEPGYFEIMDLELSEKIAWILGQSYSGRLDIPALKHDIQSRIWLTYRKNFASIGGTGPTSDQGWGCMLRCGQMMLAQALLLRHLGRGWRWSPNERDLVYLTMLRLFQDKKDRFYSIHQIAQMGVSEGKKVGEWFGPNTIAHVLRKLSIYDNWSKIAIHIAMDNTVVLDDLRRVCHSKYKPSRKQLNLSPSEFPASNGICTNDSDDCGGCFKCYDCHATTSEQAVSADLISGSAGTSIADKPDRFSDMHLRNRKNHAASDGSPSREKSNFERNFEAENLKNPEKPLSSLESNSSAYFSCSENEILEENNRDAAASVRSIPSSSEHQHGDVSGGVTSQDSKSSQLEWKPLMLVIPLRLGLNQLNPVYINAIRECFMLKQCLGIIGGRPNHALYFLGFAGDELIYLDPHFCQPTVDLDVPQEQIDDHSFHAQLLLKMPVSALDPSLALGFYCSDEADLNDLCVAFRKSLLRASDPPLFELVEQRPKHWPRFEPYTGEQVSTKPEFTMVEPQYDTDEEFEILD